jgi:hypothetical protein
MLLEVGLELLPPVTVLDGIPEGKIKFVNCDFLGCSSRWWRGTRKRSPIKTLTCAAGARNACASSCVGRTWDHLAKERLGYQPDDTVGQAVLADQRGREA